MGKFKVGDEVKFIGSTKDDFGYRDLKVGKVYNVKENSFEDGVVVIIDEVGDEVSLDSYRYNGFELIKSKPSKKQRIEILEKEVSELKLIVHELRERKVVEPSTVEDVLQKESVEVIEFEGAKYRKVERLAKKGDVVVFRENETHSKFSTTNTPYLVVADYGDGKADFYSGYLGTNFSVYAKDHKRTPETVDVYELITEPSTTATVEDEPKSPNQLRAEIIEKAKGFVESVIKRGSDVDERYGDIGNETYRTHFYAVDFHSKNNKITALVSRTDGYGKKIQKSPHHIGRSKCNPSDVFNEHIGKAIALGRALGLDVSEFEQAVQPNEYVVGQIISFHSLSGQLESEELTKVNGKELWMGDRYISSVRHEMFKVADKPIIINDTNAIYGGVE